MIVKKLSKISLISMAGAAMFVGGCAHREVVAAPPPPAPPPAQTQTMDQTQTQQMDQTQTTEHRGERGI